MIFCGSSRVNRRIGACSTSAIEPKTSERRESDSTNFVLGSSRSLRGSHLSTAATTNARFDVRAPFFRRRFVRETFLAAVPLAATRTPRHRDIFFQTFIAVRASAADVANDEKIRAVSAKTSFRASTVRGAQAQLIWIVLRSHSLLTSIAKERVVAPRARLQHAVRATIAMLAK